MVNVFAAIGRLAVRFRWFIIAAWVVAAFVVSAALPSLSSVTQSNNGNFLPSSAPSAHAADLASPFQKSGQITVDVVVYRAAGTLSPGDTGAIARLGADLRAVSDVAGIKDLGRSAGGNVEHLQVLASSALGGGPGSGTTIFVDDLRSAVARASLPSGLHAHTAGSTADQVDNQKNSGSTGNSIEILSELFIIVLLLIVFRSLLAPFVTLLPAVLVDIIAGPVVAELTHAGLKVSSLAQLMMIVLVLGAGTDYGLFLIFRVRENLYAGLDKREAVVQAVAKVGESITFSALTVIAALLSLLAATFGIYSNLAFPLAIGIGIMLLAGLTLLPALLAVLGRAVFWPMRPRPDHHNAGKTGMWGRLAARLIQRPVLVMSAGVVVLAALAVCAFGYKSAGFSSGSGAPAGSDSAAGDAALQTYFPEVSADPTLLVYKLRASAWTGPDALVIAQRDLTSRNAAPLFTTVAGPLNPQGLKITTGELVSLHAQLGDPRGLPATEPATIHVTPALYQAYRSTAQYISTDGHTVEFSVGLRAGNSQSTAAMNAMPAIRSEASSVARAIGAADYGVSGYAATFHDVSTVSTHDLYTVIPLAIVIIGLLLGVVMRSLVAPLYLIASVGLSYLAALGFAVLFFMKIQHASGLTFILPFMLFLFLLALGEDYNILVMTRVREEAHHLPLRQAVSRAVGITGTTVTSAGLVLAGTFAVFALAGGSGNTQIRDMGTGLAVGILLDTFLVRTLLVPSAVVLLGRWNWWPSRLSARHDHLEAASGPAADTAAHMSVPR